MGTILTGYGDAAYEHEGYAAQVLDDGSITGTYSAQTKPRMIGAVVAACDCGWQGSTRYPTRELFDEDAEQLALAEWEHQHALPTLRTAHAELAERLQRLLAEHATRLGRHWPTAGPAEQRALLNSTAD